MALLVLLLVAYIDGLFFPETLDDAFITFRYSDHLAEGYGFGAWNRTGERVEGYSSPLWMILLAAARPLGIETVTLSKILGMTSHAALVLLFLAFPRIRTKGPGEGEPEGRIFLFAALFCLLYLPLAFYATSGMETTAFIFLSALALLLPAMTDHPVPACCTAVALVLIRPEGILFCLGAAACHLIRRRGSGERLQSPRMLAGAGLLTAAGLTIFRLAVFGDVLPNTYYAKASGELRLHVVAGVLYVWEFALYNKAFVATIGAGTVAVLLSARSRGVKADLVMVFSLCFTALYTGYIIKVGGDNLVALPYWRHFLHLTPFLALIVSAAAVRLVPARRLGPVLFFGAFIIASDYAALRVHYGKMAALLKDRDCLPLFTNSPPHPYYLWIARMTARGDRVASTMAGELPYVVDAVHIDILGLNDRHIARHGQYDPEAPIDSRTDMAYVLERRPDIIDGFISSRTVTDGPPLSELRTIRLAMCRAMFLNPVFREEYVFVVNGPYDSLDRAIFMHRDFVTRHPLRREIQVIPVSETPILLSLRRRVGARGG